MKRVLKKTAGFLGGGYRRISLAFCDLQGLPVAPQYC